MALNQAWLQDLILGYVTLEAPGSNPASGSDSGGIGRAAIDGALVVYDLNDPPPWLIPVLERRNEDGNTRD